MNQAAHASEYLWPCATPAAQVNPISSEDMARGNGSWRAAPVDYEAMFNRRGDGIAAQPTRPSNRATLNPECSDDSPVSA